MSDFRLPVPSFVRTNADSMEPPNIKAAMVAGFAARDLIRKAGFKVEKDEKKGIFLVDALVAFLSQEKGGLFVPGSKPSLQRFVDDFLRDILYIDEVYTVNDLHGPNHIGTPLPWLLDDQTPVGDPFYVVDPDLVTSGRLLYSPDPLWAFEYVEEHMTNGFGPVVLYPPHAIEGSGEDQFMPSVIEALTYWAAMHGKRWRNDRKGYYDKSEQLGGIRPNVLLPDVQDGGKNVKVVSLLDKPGAPRFEFGGWAANYCLMATVMQLIYEFRFAPDVRRRFTLRTDWTQGIPGPNDDDYAKLLLKLPELGVKVV